MAENLLTRSALFPKPRAPTLSHFAPSLQTTRQPSGEERPLENRLPAQLQSNTDDTGSGENVRN